MTFSRFVAMVAPLTLAVGLLCVNGCGSDELPVYVYDHEGRELQGVEVHDFETEELYGTTGEDGRVSIGLEGDMEIMRFRLEWAPGWEQEDLQFDRVYERDVKGAMSGVSLLAHLAKAGVGDFSTLIIRSTPDSAEIHLDGLPVGRTPISLPDLVSGSVHDIELSLEGWLSQSKTVQLDPGEHIEDWQLVEDSAHTATLTVNSTPSGASIVLDRNATDKQTPATFRGLKPGPHRVKLRLDGYRDWSNSYNLIAGQQKTVKKTLSKKGTGQGQSNTGGGSQGETQPVFSKSYTIRSYPAYAEVYVDGDTANRNVMGSFKMVLTQGTHTFYLVNAKSNVDLTLSYKVPKNDANNILILDYNERKVRPRP